MYNLRRERERADVTNRTHNFKRSHWIFATTKTGKLILGGVLRGRDYQPKTFPDKTAREVALSGPEWPWAEEEAKWLDQLVLPRGAKLEAVVRLSWTLCDYVVLGEIWHLNVFMSLLYFLYWWVLPGCTSGFLLYFAIQWRQIETNVRWKWKTSNWQLNFVETKTVGVCLARAPGDKIGRAGK